jgi:predicted metalloprotease with PDZ domain
MSDNAIHVEYALTQAVKEQKDFYQYASVIDLLIDSYISDSDIKQKFLKELAESIKGH